MGLSEKIGNDLKEAMKAKDATKVSTLRFLRSDLEKKAIEARSKELEDAQVLEVIRKQVKQHQESLEAFKKGNRTDLAEKEEKETAILKSYLPAELSEDQVSAVIQECIQESGASSPKEMGQVMKLAMGKLKGQADGKLVSRLVSSALGPGK